MLAGAWLEFCEGLLRLKVHLIVKETATIAGVEQEILYDDYRAVDGVQVPYRWTVGRPAGQFTIQAMEIKQNVPVDDEKFAKPATAPQGEHGSDR